MPLEDDPGLAAGWLLCGFVLWCFIRFETADVMEGLTSTKCLHRLFAVRFLLLIITKVLCTEE